MRSSILPVIQIAPSMTSGRKMQSRNFLCLRPYEVPYVILQFVLNVFQFHLQHAPS